MFVISGNHRFLRKSRMERYITPGTDKKANITVSAELPDGGKRCPAREFRVKRFPDPSLRWKTPSDR